MFNEKKYRRCIGHLISSKITIIIFFTIIFAIIGGCIGYFAVEEETVGLIGAVVGGIIGILFGISATWRIEMHIQESYWRIDALAEMKKMNMPKTTVNNVKNVSVNNANNVKNVPVNNTVANNATANKTTEQK